MSESLKHLTASDPSGLFKHLHPPVKYEPLNNGKLEAMMLACFWFGGFGIGFSIAALIFA